MEGDSTRKASCKSTEEMQRENTRLKKARSVLLQIDSEYNRIAVFVMLVTLKRKVIINSKNDTKRLWDISASVASILTVFLVCFFLNQYLPSHPTSVLNSSSKPLPA